MLPGPSPFWRPGRPMEVWFPAARVKPVGELVWFLDRAAAGQG